MSLSTSTAVPSPFSVSPSWSWDGDDGSWSTFLIGVGSPQQSFRVLPSTTGAETWIPIPAGCEGILENVANCGTLRGANSFDGRPSRGFETDVSSTWDLIGIYELATEQNLWGPTGNPGQYGLDTVAVESYPSGKAVELKSQTVAGVATANVWLGAVGLGTGDANFDVKKGSVPSLLDTMKSQNITPSLSFGFTAGASYSSPKVPGSLVLGGYDQARFKPSHLNLPINGTKNKTLPLRIASIIAENVFGGTLSLLPSGNAVDTLIDSTTSQLWLPQNVCDLFAQAFGLKYDPYSGLYLVNSTIHRQLTQMNPSVTFTIGSTGSSSSTTNIVLPYAAFDLQAGIPLFNYSTNYFPLRVAANASQQILGRAFLQEAYIFVDWERNNFTIGQAIHQNSTTNIVSVLAPFDSGQQSSSSLGTSAIVGIAIGACAAVAAIIGIIALLIVRSRRRRRPHRTGSESEMPLELHDETAKPPEIYSAQIYEMQEGEHSKHEIYSKQVSELQAESLEQELSGDGERLGKHEKKHVFELP